MRKKYRYPRNMKEARSVLASICHSKEWDIEIYFDDKFGNFTGNRDNQAIYSSGEYVECSRYDDDKYELLVAAVLHELGHKATSEAEDKEGQGVWANEFAAWAKAMELHRKYFKRNFSFTQARYAMECLDTYMPDLSGAVGNDSRVKEQLADFWCPMQKKILK